MYPTAIDRLEGRWRWIVAGRAHEALNDVDAAVDAYQAYLTEPPVGNALPLDGVFLFDTLERLGHLYESRRDQADAAKYYARAADLWKDADRELQPRVQRLREWAVALGGAHPAPSRQRR